MGKAVKASMNGFAFDLLCDKYHASGRLSKNKISVVILASLNDSMNGVRSRFFRVSSITLH